jgi:hypothetical protein
MPSSFSRQNAMPFEPAFVGAALFWCNYHSLSSRKAPARVAAAHPRRSRAEIPTILCFFRAAAPTPSALGDREPAIPFGELSDDGAWNKWSALPFIGIQR